MKFFEQPKHIIIPEFILVTIVLIGFLYNFWMNLIIILIVFGLPETLKSFEDLLNK